MNRKSYLVIGLFLLFFAASACSKEEGVKEVTVSDSQQDPENNQDQMGMVDADGAVVDADVDKGQDSQKIQGKGYGTLEEAPVWSFDLSGDFKPWDSDMPYINPMGERDAYREVLFSKNTGMDIYYNDEDNYRINRTVVGDTYRMILPFDEEKDEAANLRFLYDVQTYMDDIEGALVGRRDDFVAYRAEDPAGDRWWCGIEVTNNYEFVITVVKEEILELGESIHINTKAFDNNVYRFTTYSDGTQLESGIWRIEEGNCFVNIYGDRRYGSYVRSFSYNMGMESYQGEYYIIDDMMMEAGPYFWEVYWYDESEPSLLEVSLKTSGDIPQVRYGERLGAIKVSTSVAESITVRPTGADDLYLSHPEVPDGGFKMDLTPDGDYMMYVPSGMWDVEIVPKGQKLLNNYVTKMVPVNAGEITTVKVPLKYEQVLSSEDTDQAFRGLAMELPTVKNGQGMFNFTLVDREIQDVVPDRDNTLVTEGGKSVDIIDISRIDTPPSVVLLLDSSGSMKGQMDQTLEGARSFIEGLPEGAWVKVVDFDTEAKPLEGTTKDQALSALDRISVGGATALYDTMLKGYDILSERSRPTLVLFTDGTDANYNDTAPGSKATFEEVFDVVKANRASLYTIGFGKDHDRKTLEAFAMGGGGLYYSAEDEWALTEVFDAINNKLNNSFKLTYKRPKEATPSDIPMVSFVVDISGSMFSDEDDSCGWRLDDVKNVIHDFVLELPEEAQMQLMAFNDEIIIKQSSTTDKTRVLRALGELEAFNGTDIIGSVEAGYKTLEMMPSTRKVMIYITDAALGVDDGEEAAFDFYLSSMKEKGMNVLWVGLGIDEEAGAFVSAADKSGGRYVLSQDPKDLRQVFDEVLADTMAKPQESFITNLQIDIEKVAGNGARKAYTANLIAEMPPLPRSEEVSLAETVIYETGKPLLQYDLSSAQLLSGRGLPGIDTTLTKRLPLEVKASNEALEMTGQELFYLSSIGGVQAPDYQRFVAVKVKLSHILPLQKMVVYPEGTGHPASWVGGGSAATGEVKEVKVPYLIPDFRSHFYMTYNDQGAYPASTATWLANQPLALPGNHSIMVNPDDSETGILVFLVPDEATNQCSLHFYDSNYGHIDLPLVGVVNRHDIDVNALPNKINGSLSDTFDLSVTGIADGNQFMNITGEGENSFFRVVEGSFDSRVQALLAVDPMERFSMRFPTEKGDFYVGLHPMTAMVPSGFAGGRMLAPGSFNQVRWVFEIPDGMASAASQIFMDLQGDSGYVDVIKESPIEAGYVALYNHDYFDLTVNSLTSVENLLDDYGNWVIADVTVSDKRDGFSTGGLEKLLYLKVDAAEDEEPSPREEEGTGLGNFGQNSGGRSDFYPDTLTDRLIFGMDKDTVVYDGMALRGQIAFLLPDEADTDDYTLTSDVVDGIALKSSTGTYPEELLGLEGAYDLDTTFTENLQEAVSRRINQYQALHPQEADSLIGSAMTEEPPKPEVPAIAMTAYGEKTLMALTSEKDLWNLIRQMGYTPDPDGLPQRYSMAPEALITQGYGTAPEMAKLAYDGLCLLGFKPSVRIVELTAKGKEWLKVKSGYEDLKVYELPALQYEDKSGVSKTMVMPFVQELKELDGSVFMEQYEPVELETKTAYMTIGVLGDYMGGSAADVGVDVVDALGGDTSGERLYYEEIFAESLNMDTLSMDAIDLMLYRSGNDLYAMVSGAGGEKTGKTPLNLLDFKVEKVRVEVSMPGQPEWIHEVAVTEKMPVEQIFMTMGLGLPAMTENAAKYLEQQSIRTRALVEDVNALSAMQWYTRSMIFDFIRQQTELEKNLNRAYGLVANHVATERGIAMTLRKGSGLRTGIDLMETGVDFHSGSLEAQKSYRLIHGLNVSLLEGAVLKSGNGIAEIWSAMPEGGKIMIFDSDAIDGNQDLLRKMGMSQTMIEYLGEANKVFMMQSKPSSIGGEDHWAWFEYDPFTGKIISVLDTGEHGAITSESVLQTYVGAAQFVVGAFKGIETSVWSVAVYSLEETDYEVILKKAKALAMGIGENLSALDPKGMLTDMAKNKAKETAKNAMTGAGMSGGSADFVLGLHDGSSLNLPGAPSKEDYMGYQNGFKAGVDYYFNQAK